MFEQHLEVFNKGDHYRVCLRLRNWANESLGKGTPKYFSYRVNYAAPPPTAAPPTAAAKTPPKELPKKLPPSGSPLPLLGLLGIGLLILGSTLRLWVKHV